ncbi:MAG: 30S ribosomal protein S6 [Candidatus Izimaplasma sp.]|nr:30S ribosomal protein S6 [Candidatus Izimaplasma bacterium]
MNNIYEIMYIIRPTTVEEDRKALVKRFEDLFSQGDSEVVELDEWGTRSLAYEIEDFNKGYYVVLTIKADNETRNEFERQAKLSEDVLRYLIVRRDDL